MTEEQQQAAELDDLVLKEEQTEQQAIEGDYQPADGQQSASMSTADLIAPMLKVSFALIASIKGEHWAISDDVATEAANEYASCLDHYFPDFQGAPWVGAAMTTGMILAPRLMQDKAIDQARMKAEQQGEAKESNSEKGANGGN